MKNEEKKSRISWLMENIRALQSELDAELAKQRARLSYGLEKGRAVFEQEILRRHKELKVNLFKYITHANILTALTAPVIYAMIVPFVFLDICVSIYQFVCFPAYGITKVKRSDYIVFDREYLAYLNLLQKINCGYCSYANGVAGYVREVAGRTEEYWCPIKHAKKMINAHEHYKNFAEFGDAESFRELMKHEKPLRKEAKES